MSTLYLPTLTPPRESRWAVPLVMALVAHALLVAALTWGITWKKDTPPTVVQAELWSRLPQSAAARLVEEAPPPPTPAPEPEPAPAPKPAPPPKPAPAPPDLAKQQADIALQQKKQREEKERQAEAEALKKAQQKHEQDKREQDRLEQARREAQARQLKEQQDKKKHEAEQKAAEEARLKAQKQQAALDKAAQEKKAQEQNAKAQQVELARQRAENLRRMQGLAGATGAAGSTGTAKQSSGPSASYAGRINAAVRPNIVFTDNVPGNPSADVEVRTLPDGTVASRRIVKSSGVPSWDDAVLKALDRTGKLPRDEDGRVPSSLIIGFRMKD
jgi:colicin import membrane protein